MSSITNMSVADSFFFFFIKKNLIRKKKHNVSHSLRIRNWIKIFMYKVHLKVQILRAPSAACVIGPNTMMLFPLLLLSLYCRNVYTRRPMKGLEPGLLPGGKLPALVPGSLRTPRHPFSSVSEMDLSLFRSQ